MYGIGLELGFCWCCVVLCCVVVVVVVVVVVWIVFFLGLLLLLLVYAGSVPFRDLLFLVFCCE